MNQMLAIYPVPVGENAILARASIANAWNSSGNLVGYSEDVVRYNWNPGTGVFEGALWEPNRKNLFWNSTNLPTQTVTVSNEAVYTISFYGAGKVTITGSTSVDGVTSVSRQISGVGASRVHLTFKAKTSSLTFTVSGSCDYANLELGSFPTSWITTYSGEATRAGETFSGSGMFNSTFDEPTDYYSTTKVYGLGELVRIGNRIYESLQAANENHDPLTEPDQFLDEPETPVWWLDLRPSNDFAMFDRVQAESSVGVNGVQNFSFKTNSDVNAVAFLNCKADIIHVAVSNGNGGLATGIATVKGGTAVFTELDVPGGTANGAVVSVFAERSAGVVSIGEFVCGTKHALGLTQYGLKYGITDYSSKKTNQYGVSRFVKRGYAKRVTASLLIGTLGTTNGEYDLTNIVQLLEYLRASPTVWVACSYDNLSSVSVVYGSYRDFTVAVNYPGHALCELEIDGLI